MNKDFHFGIEGEYMLANAQDFTPLWYKDVTFKTLDHLFESISLDALPPLTGLSPEPPHKKLMPFIVEGYGIPGEDFNIIDAYPKGIEIRTPVCGSLTEVLSVYETLYQRVKAALKSINLCPIAISHHPLYSSFSGPQNKRRHDYWAWAMEVMTTYGPDINISFPSDLSKKVFEHIPDIHLKVNYYSPAMAALSLASPFLDGGSWESKGFPGKSYRTFKRSIVAPAIELHPDENNRIEFKVFDMTKRSADFENYFLLVLTLFLDEELKGRASNQERIYDLGSVAVHGLRAEGMRKRMGELYERAWITLPKFGFDPGPLKSLIPIIETNRTEADVMRELFLKTNSIHEVMRNYSYHELKTGEKI